MTTPRRKTPTKRAPAAPSRKPMTMDVQLKPGETQDRAIAGMVGRGLITNASTAVRYLQGDHGELSLMDMARELREQGDAINCGDFAVSERMLNAQAVALNMMFAELARRAALNMGEYIGAAETYMRLALKAQSQCRTTIETLAAMKNPPIVFARQANIANGPQQVNNGEVDFRDHKNARALDFGAQGEAGGANPNLAAVGQVNWPAKC